MRDESAETISEPVYAGVSDARGVSVLDALSDKDIQISIAMSLTAMRQRIFWIHRTLVVLAVLCGADFAITHWPW